MAAVVHQKGILRQKRGEYDGALELYQKSLAIQERLGDLAGMSKSHWAIGVVHLAREEKEKAREALRRAAALFREMKLPVPVQLEKLLADLDGEEGRGG